jgi:molecular chaperone DnaK (HSP70)
LIPRNTPLPVTAKRVFRTQRAAQRSILVRIVEGESASPDDCSQIGKCVVRDLPPELPAQTPIDVRFAYQENGRLTVHVSVAGTGRELKHEITRENSLTPEQLDAWRLYITGQQSTQPAHDDGGYSLSGDSSLIEGVPYTPAGEPELTIVEDTTVEDR